MPFPDLGSKGFKPAAVRILTAALERGSISTHEIATVMPKGTTRDPAQLAETISWLRELFKSRQVRLVSDKEEPAHRQQHPIAAQEQKSEFRRISNRTQVAMRKGIAVPVERLDYEGTRFERDPLKFYYLEIRRYPLLTPDEERELGRRIWEDRDLDARNKLVEHNLRLVRWAARRWAWTKIDFEDLLQQGNEGLITAAEKYDYRVGRFTTYASWWIRQAISRFIQDYGSIIRLPVHIQELNQKILKASEEIAAKVGRIPTVEEIAAQSKIPVDKIRRTLRRMRIETVSLDEALGAGKYGDDLTIGDSIADDRIITADLYIEACQELDAAKNRLDTALRQVTQEIRVSARDLDAFEAFYGLDGSGRQRTLEFVGQQFGISRERVRQIIGQIWAKVDEHGGDMDHDRFLEEQIRIDELQKLVAPATN